MVDVCSQAWEDEARAKRVASFSELYRLAQTRGGDCAEALEALTREEIYRQRVR